MVLSDRGLALIKEYEGFRAHAYKCPAGVWTIGFGTTKNVQPGDKITKREAERRLREDLHRFQVCVTKAVNVPLSQGQYDALVSLCYNIGEGAFRKSTLLKLLNQRRYDAACAQFDRWVKAGGRTLPGLQRRRDAEQALFRSGADLDDDEPISPSVPVEATKGDKSLSGSEVAAGATIVTAGGSAVFDKASDLADKHSSLLDTMLSSQAIGIWCGVIVVIALAYLGYRYLKAKEERL